MPLLDAVQCHGDEGASCLPSPNLITDNQFITSEPFRAPSSFPLFSHRATERESQSECGHNSYRTITVVSGEAPVFHGRATPLSNLLSRRRRRSNKFRGDAGSGDKERPHHGERDGGRAIETSEGAISDKAVKQRRRFQGETPSSAFDKVKGKQRER